MERLAEFLSDYLAGFGAGRTTLTIVLVLSLFAVPRGYRRYPVIALVLVALLDSAWLFLVCLAGLGIIPTIRGLRRVSEGTAQLVERLGSFQRTLPPGTYMLIPWVEQVRTDIPLYTYERSGERRRSLVDDRGGISTQEQILDPGSIDAVAADGAQVSVDVFTTFKIVSPKDAVYGVADLAEAMTKQIDTTVRQRVATSPSRALTSEAMEGLETSIRDALRQHSAAWGTEVVQVGVPEIRIVKDDSERRTLYFCDGCGRSVSIGDFLAGNIKIEGRVICDACGSKAPAEG